MAEIAMRAIHASRRDDYAALLDMNSIPHEDEVPRVGGLAGERVKELRYAEETLRAGEDWQPGAEQLEAVGRLTAEIAHDFNNLLMVFNGYIEILRSDAILHAAPKAQRAVDELALASQSARRLIQQLLVLSRQQTPSKEPLSLNGILAEIEQMLTPLLGVDIETVVDLDAGLDLCIADRGQLERVIVNLVLNARDAMPTGGLLSLKTENATLDERWAAEHPGGAPGSYVLLSVVDTGTGMDAEMVVRVLEASSTTKAEGRRYSMGLGLESVYGIVEQHGGYIDLESAPGEGTHVRVYLPAARVIPAQPPAAASRAGATPGRSVRRGFSLSTTMRASAR